MSVTFHSTRHYQELSYVPGSAGDGRPSPEGPCATAVAANVGASRTRLLELSIGLVEDARNPDAGRGKSDERFCGAFQVCLPYRGLFVWHVAGDDVVGDANQVVFVRAGESYRLSSPVRGWAELIVTPDRDLLSEIAHVEGTPLAEHLLFRRRAIPASPGLQLFRARFHRWAATASHERDPLQAEEVVVALLRAALRDDGRRAIAGSSRTAGLIARAKEFLEAHLSVPVKLADVGAAVGASPAYLTDVFRRIEGMPLHQYLVRLRLARALVELDRRGDITEVALATGFSSHSHFTLAFRRTFGCTPSEYRGTWQRSRISLAKERDSAAAGSWPIMVHDAEGAPT